MCSIAGAFFFLHYCPDLALKTVQKIITQTAHRGPDAQNFFSCNVGRIIFGHARLAIVDCEARSNQPLESKAHSKTIIFNGEIYNHKTLKVTLESLGYQFSTKSDTEVLLFAFDAWGSQCLDKLEGVFAFAIFDHKSKTLFCARDRFGVKPFFFAHNQTGFYFSSSARALLNWSTVKPELSAQGVWHYLTLMAFPAPFTPLTNVYSLPAGFCVTIKADGRMSFGQWYSLEEKILAGQEDLKSISFGQACEQTQELMISSLNKRISDEVRSGIFLSGGLDSTLIAVLAQASGQKFFDSGLESFNLSFDFDPENSEQEWAARVAKKLGFKHHSIVVTRPEFQKAFDEMMASLDCPVSDPVNIPFFILSKFSRAQGVKVVFVGEGADELFGGYSWYFKLAKLQYWLPKIIPRVLSRGLGAVCEKLGRSFLSQTFTRHSRGQELFWTSANLFSEQEKLDLLAGNKGGQLNELVERFGVKECLKSLFKAPITQDKIINQIYPGLPKDLCTASFVKYFADRLKTINQKADSFLNSSYIDFVLRIPNLLMSRVDQMSMANSVEVREPFLDHKLVEFALALPTEIRVHKNEQKPILKAILAKHFGAEFLNRKKIGFSTPIQKLF